MTSKFVIDCFPEAATRYKDDHAIIAVDVIRATTTATTAISLNRRVHIVQTTDEAFVLAKQLEETILAGELGGNVPYGFDMTNSPVLIAALSSVDLGEYASPIKEIILLSSSGTQLILNSVGSQQVYLACFRNFTAVAEYASQRHKKIAIIGAGTRGVFRREDQMGCAWTAARLLEMGYQAENEATEKLIRQWSHKQPDLIRDGRSADYLRRTGQIYDLEFIVNHIDDLKLVPVLRDRIVMDAEKK